MGGSVNVTPFWPLHDVPFARNRYFVRRPKNRDLSSISNKHKVVEHAHTVPLLSRVDNTVRGLCCRRLGRTSPFASPPRRRPGRGLTATVVDANHKRLETPVPGNHVSHGYVTRVTCPTSLRTRRRDLNTDRHRAGNPKPPSSSESRTRPTEQRPRVNRPRPADTSIRGDGDTQVYALPFLRASSLNRTR